MKQDKLVEAIKNSIKQVLNEGPGAGYDVSFKGLNISQLRSFKVGEKNGQRIIEFKAILAPGIVEWSAAGYYDSVTSKGIYYDNELVDEFDEQQKTVNGGELSGYVYESEVSDYMANGGQVTTKDVADYIRWHLQDFSFKTMVGGGYVHTDLSDPMVFENVEVTPENTYYGSEGVYLNYIEIRAKEISDTINWFFANCYNFDEIFGQNEEDYAEEQPVNESLKKAIKESITKVLNESDGQDIDADTYFGGGLPETQPSAHTYTPEKEVTQIIEQMRPYVDKLADIFNNYNCISSGAGDKVFDILNGVDELPKLAKYFSNTEID